MAGAAPRALENLDARVPTACALERVMTRARADGLERVIESHDGRITDEPSRTLREVVRSVG